MPCILLHRLVPGGELKDCAQDIVVQPMSRDMHHSKMDEDVMRVRLITIVPEFRDVQPPIQPPGAEEDMVLKDWTGWMMKWPKTQIRLGTGLLGLRRTTGATSRPPIVRPSRPRIVRPSSKPAAITATQKEPTVVATSSRHQKLLGAPVPQPTTPTLD